MHRPRCVVPTTYLCGIGNVNLQIRRGVSEKPTLLTPDLGLLAFVSNRK
jgi:hypothetical protein